MSIGVSSPLLTLSMIVLSSILMISVSALVASDNRFYCKMHEQVYEYVVCTRKNTHVPPKYFDVQMLRDSLPDVIDRKSVV